jgi:type 1 glutamine amidotransferase
MSVTRSVILSGGGEYADPWHPFAATSEQIAGVLRGLGHDVQICDRVADRVADLRDAGLIVVNAADGPQADTSAAQAGLLAALERGIGVLAVHVGACTLLRLPAWESVTGARWITGQSMHPRTGPSHILTYPERHVIAGPVSAFDIVDERYAYLRTAPDIVPLAEHEHDGRLHPLVWAREAGPSRVVTDLLGHDTRSYDCAEHRRLISRAARWLTGAL